MSPAMYMPANPAPFRLPAYPIGMAELVEGMTLFAPISAYPQLHVERQAAGLLGPSYTYR